MARSMAVSLAWGLILTSGIFMTGALEAAESYDNCNNFIDSLPVTISTQGVWCLRKDVATGINSGAAIQIDTNNVTINCNGFKIGGLAAGPVSKTKGISATGRQNITVRGCSVRGFYTGIYIGGGGGHMVERNRLDHNLSMGISVGDWFGSATENSVIQGNTISDTGSPEGSSVVGIFSNGGDVIDNTVSGLFTKGDGATYGIVASKSGAVIRGNRVRDMEASNKVEALGIWAPGSDARIEDNSVAIVGAGSGHIGILGDSGYWQACADNTSAGFPVPIDGCVDGGGNASL